MDQQAPDIFTHTPLRQLNLTAWYRGAGPGVPDLLALRPNPAMFEGDARARAVDYRVIFVETNEDRALVEDALNRPLTRRNGVFDWGATIDRPNLKRSVLPRGKDGFILYAPPSPGWRGIMVTSIWANECRDGFHRGRYRWQYADLDFRVVDGEMVAVHP